MTDAAFAARLGRTYYYHVSAFRSLIGGGEAAVYVKEPCALSRSAQVSAPTPADRDYVLPETLYRLSLFTMPEVLFQLGDRLEIYDRLGNIYHARASDSFCYPSHTVTVVEISQIRHPKKEEEGV